MQIFDATIKEELNKRLEALEQRFDADVIFYYGEIHPALAKTFRDFIERLIERLERLADVRTVSRVVAA